MGEVAESFSFDQTEPCDGCRERTWMTTSYQGQRLCSVCFVTRANAMNDLPVDEVDQRPLSELLGLPELEVGTDVVAEPPIYEQGMLPMEGEA